MVYVYMYNVYIITQYSHVYSYFLFSVDLDPKVPMQDCFQKFGLDQNTVDFVGHALALHRDDQYATD